MPKPKVVSREQWLTARVALLQKEKAFTRERDALSAERRELPWVKVDKQYEFETTEGKKSLVHIFDGRQQLIVYHFMFGPDWQEGCPGCSFWADNFDGTSVHLQQRDISLVAVSNAPLDRLLDYKKRMGWSFTWISSLHNEFNSDYHVSFSDPQIEPPEVFYNYKKSKFESGEMPGISVFYRDQNNQIFHTYSCYARGLDMVNGAYQMMDLTPKGRDEDDLPFPSAWLCRHDAYQD